MLALAPSRPAALDAAVPVTGADDLRDPDAFRAAALEHGPAMLRIARRLVGDGAAEDLVQDALTEAFAARGRFRGEAHPRTWLCGVLVNRCRRELRRRRLRAWLSFRVVDDAAPAAGAPEPAAPDPPPAEALARADETAALRAAIARLPDGQRAALVLVSLEGLPAREAAAALGTSEAAVWQAVSRARAALRRALGPEGDRP